MRIGLVAFMVALLMPVLSSADDIGTQMSDEEMDQRAEALLEMQNSMREARNPLEARLVSLEMMSSFPELAAMSSSGEEIERIKSHLQDPAYAAWQETFLNNLDESDLDRERNRFRAAVARIAEIDSGDVRAFVSDLGGTKAEEVEAMKNLEPRLQRLGLQVRHLTSQARFTDLEGSAARIAADEEAPFMVISLMIGSGDESDSAISRDEKRRLQKIDKSLGKAQKKVKGKSALSAYAANQRAIVKCALQDREAAAKQLERAKKDAPSQRDLLAARTNEIFCGDPRKMMQQLNINPMDAYRNPAQMMQMMNRAMLQAIEDIYEEAVVTVPISDPLVAETASLASMYHQMLNDSVAARRITEDFWVRAGQDLDPLWSAWLQQQMAMHRMLINDLPGAWPFVEGAETLVAGLWPDDVPLPEIQEPVEPQTREEMVSSVQENTNEQLAQEMQGLSPILKLVGRITGDEDLSGGVEGMLAQPEAQAQIAAIQQDMFDLQDRQDPAAAPKFEPDDRREAVAYYMDHLWAMAIEPGRFENVLEDLTNIYDLPAFYRRVLALWMLRYDSDLDVALNAVSANISGATNESMPYLSFAEQQAFLDQVIPFHTSMVLSLGADELDVQDAYADIVGWKGLLIEATRRQGRIVRAAIDSPSHRASAERLIQIRSQLSAHFISRNPNEDSMAALTEEKESIERSLNEAFAANVPHIEPIYMNDLSAHLSNGAVFVDLYRYDLWQDTRFAATNYAAAIVYAGGDVQFIDLGEAESIHDAIADWRAAVIRGTPASADEAEGMWDRLESMLWAPLRNAGVGSARVYLSPDQELARIPWRQFAGERLTQVDSARAFIASRSRRTQQGGSALFVGDVDFGSGRLGVTPLPGTGAEVLALQSIANDADIDAVAVGQNAATEQRIKQELGSARWAHVATHGLFLETEGTRASTRGFAVVSSTAQSAAPDQILNGPRNPMLASGLALADINSIEGSRMDGFLTAEEIIDLDLGQTDLIVLSACNTGRGIETNGQGVIGLRSALSAAGAGSILMSLWEVPDLATSELMQKFYSALWDERLPASAALERAQAELRADPRFEHPFNWAAWVLVDGSPGAG
ncbi:MAG: CHAT domain-containing protein [Gammaproteobacteria bacterium]|nr:CHAT domain-containing protein [Gammaproteobacteria bacterium]